MMNGETRNRVVGDEYLQMFDRLFPDANLCDRVSATAVSFAHMLYYFVLIFSYETNKSIQIAVTAISTRINTGVSFV
jgi:hypothetical protein